MSCQMWACVTTRGPVPVISNEVALRRNTTIWRYPRSLLTPFLCPYFSKPTMTKRKRGINKVSAFSIRFFLIKSSRLRIKTKRLLVTHKSNQANTVPLRMRCSLCLEMIRELWRGVQAVVISTWSGIMTIFHSDSNRNLSLEPKTLAQHLRPFSKPQIVWRSVVVHSIAP